jgi:uncharacterized protein (TIGR00369 family)
LPFGHEIGMRLHQAEAGVAVLSVPYDARLIGDPETGVLHGGVITALLDTACGWAVMASPAKLQATATLDLRIDYMRPATAGEAVFSRAECYRLTRSVGFARAVAYHTDPLDGDRAGCFHAGEGHAGEGHAGEGSERRGCPVTGSQPASDRQSERDAVLAALTGWVPYNRLLGVRFDRLGDELTARLPFREGLVGNPFLPAIHGGVTGSFLEITGIMQLAWDRVLGLMDEGGEAAARIGGGQFPPFPKTIDITIDYLRSGRPRETFARAMVQRTGRRVLAGQPRPPHCNAAGQFPDAGRGGGVTAARRPAHACHGIYKRRGRDARGWPGKAYADSKRSRR